MIHDEFTDLPLSRQRKQQLRRQRDGLCKCGEPLHIESDAACGKCILKDRLARRLKCGFKEWRPGDPGRPPIGV